MKSIEDVPFIVGIGAQKSGTSWLYDYLKEHPDFCTPRLKELHYFDAKYLSDLCYDTTERIMFEKIKGLYRMKPDIFFRLCMSFDESVYKKYFELIYQGQSAFGEITPSYSMLDSQVYSKIANFHPRTKFIYLMRNPADRLWAHIRFYEQKFNRDIKDECENISNPVYSLRSNYQRTIEQLYKSVDKQNVLLLFYEELFCNESVEKICDFCEIPFRPGDYDRFSNKGKVVRKIDPELRRHFVQHLRYVYEYVDELFEGNIPSSWKQDIRDCPDVPHAQLTTEESTLSLKEREKQHEDKTAEICDLNLLKSIFSTEGKNPFFLFYRWRLKLRLHVSRGKMFRKYGNNKKSIAEYIKAIFVALTAPILLPGMIFYYVYRMLPRFAKRFVPSSDRITFYESMNGKERPFTLNKP